MTRDLWSWWDWQREPEAPAGWEHPERMVVLLDGGIDRNGISRIPLAAAAADVDFQQRGGIVVCVCAAEGLARVASQQRQPWGAGCIPAIAVERQSDLEASAIEVHSRLLGPGGRRLPLPALCSVKAAHRALVISPREAIDLRTILVCKRCGGTGEMYEDHGEPGMSETLSCRCRGARPIDLVVVRGPAGPDAWPMHPAWVRWIKAQCDETGVAFAFLGWGDFIPEQSYPPEINGCAKRRAAWIAGGCVGPRPDPVGVEETWWGTPGDKPSERSGRVITDWGAMDSDGSYVSGWTGWRDSQRFCRVGPERSGRLLDGTEHLALPDGL